MGFNIHILSGRNRSTNLARHAAQAASFNPPKSQSPRPLVLDGCARIKSLAALVEVYGRGA
jgi:hypothetical protein